MTSRPCEASVESIQARACQLLPIIPPRSQNVSFGASGCTPSVLFNGNEGPDARVLGGVSSGNAVRSYGIGNHVDLCGLPGAGVGHRLERALHEFGVGAPSGAAAIGYASLRHRRSLRRSDAADRVWHRLASAARASCARAAGVHRRHACLYGPRTDRANEPLDRFAQRPLCARRHILSDAHRPSAVQRDRSDGMGPLPYRQKACNACGAVGERPDRHLRDRHEAPRQDGRGALPFAPIPRR